ncbi:hypothetical protein FJZ31_28120 [Candidatus Poribacteria bacterium]|nr:hypothetical protein [Candidatus Poribacteria bacterium]
MSKKNLLSLGKLAIVMSTVLVFCWSNSSIAVEKEGVGVTMEYKHVLLENDVKEFHNLIGRFGHHAVAVGDEVYTQPYVYLSLHLVQMRSAGWKDVDFDQIAAVSGVSALFAYEHGTFEPKYAHHLIGMDDRITEATGFGYEWVGFSGINEAWAIIKESVDSGRSVKGWFWENILFAGYQDADKPEDRKIFAMADGPGTFAEWWSWEKFGKEFVDLVTRWGATGLGRQTERVPTKPANEVALRIIKDLVEWSNNPPEQIRKKYPKASFGLAGIELYADHCADMEKYEDFGSCHDINPQWPVRNSSSVYLKRVAKTYKFPDNTFTYLAYVFPDDINTHLLKASDEYKNAYIYWKQFYNHLSYGGEEGWGKIAEHRIAGTEGIRKALEHEKSAIAELKIVLEKANTPKDKKMVLDGVDKYHVKEPLFEGVRVILTYLGEPYSPDYIQGISGAAFRVAGPCPCAPTCSSQMWTTDLIKLLGYEANESIIGWKDDDVTKETQAVIPCIKNALRSGRPVLVWHAFTNAEWDVVTGFDDDKGIFSGRGSYTGLDGYCDAKQTRPQEAAKICPAFGATFIGKKTGTLDARSAELKALREAVRHANDSAETHNGPGIYGLKAYDRWAGAFKNPEKKRETGDSYCYDIYKTTHRAASGFLNEIAPKYPEASEHLRKAAEYFKAEADTLDSGADLLGWKAPEDPDTEHRAKISDLLAKARDNYRAGIGEIEQALKEIDRIK